MPHATISATPSKPRRRIGLTRRVAASALLCFAATSCASDPAFADVESLLIRQRDAWNRADLDGYMAGYAANEHTVFMGAHGSNRGFEAVRDRYKASYKTPEAFGTLTFDGLASSRLDHETILTRGRWRLDRKDDAPHGEFLLILRNFGPTSGWKIVADYTTSAPKNG
jgi:hypothetical protein